MHLSVKSANQSKFNLWVAIKLKQTGVAVIVGMLLSQKDRNKPQLTIAIRNGFCYYIVIES